MNFIFLILFITILANLVLGWVVFRNQKHSLSNKLLVLITLSLASWAASKILFLFSPPLIANAVAIPLLYISGISIVTVFLLFAHIFPKDKISFHKKFYIPALTISLLLSVGVIFSDTIVGELVEVGGIRGIVFGDLYPVYTLFIFTYFGIGHLLLWQKLKKSSGILRAQFIYVLLGVSISSLVGVITNLILPWLGNFVFFWIGPPFTIIMVVLFTYSIIRHHLLNARVIATELFTALILMIVLVDALLSDTTVEFFIRGGIFTAILIFGIFLIRGTLREIRELERLSHAKSEFVSIVSHQLRTPLTAIKGFISMIREGSGTEENKKSWLEKTYISNERLIRLVNDILNISRIERGTLQYNFKEIDITKLIDEIVEELRGQVENKGLSMAWEKPSESIPLLHADEEKIRQVFINLIDNAAKYTEKGSVIVRLIYLKDLQKVRVVVKDTGIGIKKEDMEKLFDLFSRGEGGEKTHTEGVGLGLYVAKKIAEAHKGKIRVESEGPYKGSKFSVDLPVQ